MYVSSHSSLPPYNTTLSVVVFFMVYDTCMRIMRDMLYLTVRIVGFTSITMQELFGSSEKKFSCEGCSKRYRTKQSLMTHVRHVCGKEPRFKCLSCPYKAHQKSQVQDHMASKHGILVDKTLPLT